LESRYAVLIGLLKRRRRRRRRRRRFRMRKMVDSIFDLKMEEKNER
jgi:hypothetical protein